MIEIEHTKRYVLVFNSIDTSSKYIKVKEKTYTEFDEEEEYKEELELYKELYKEEIKNKEIGCAVLDYKESKIVIILGCGVWVGSIHLIPTAKQKSLGYWEWLDKLFRGPDEIPKDYKWDNGEYEGWLRFRWGGGSNAIDKKQTKKKSLPKLIIEE